MKNGKCPKCGSATVYTRENGVTFDSDGFGAQVDTGSWTAKSSKTISYLCTACGYFENYIADPNTLAEVTKNEDWKAVPPKP